MGKALAGGRTAIGALLVTFPTLLVHVLVPRNDRSALGVLLTRLIGIRDVALGVATLDALADTRRVRVLLWLGALCDATDGVLILRQPAISRAARPLSASALFSAALGAWQASRHSDARGGVRPP